MMGFSLVPRLYDDPLMPEEARLRLILRAESPACALNQDPEAAVSELVCPKCHRHGSWETERLASRLEPASEAGRDREPYHGAKKPTVATGMVWRCTRGHETLDPERPKHEPRRGGRKASKLPAAGRNTREDELIRLCDRERYHAAYETARPCARARARG